MCSKCGTVQNWFNDKCPVCKKELAKEIDDYMPLYIDDSEED